LAVASKNKRSNYLIDKSFQLNFIVKFIALIVTCAVISGVILAGYYYIKHDAILNNGKEMFLKVIKPEITQKQSVHKDAIVFGDKKYAIFNEDLFFVDSDIMYPVYDSKKYRMKDNQLEVLVETKGTNKRWARTPIPRGYSVKDGKLGQTIRDGGKDVFSEIKQPLRSEGADSIDLNNIQFEPRYYDRFDLVWPALLFSTLLFMVISVIFGIFFTHRLAGPIYRISISLDRMIAGDFGFHIKLRRTDAFQHIASKLNTLMQVIDRKQSSSRPAPAPKAAPKKAAPKAAGNKAAPKKPGSKR